MNASMAGGVARIPASTAINPGSGDKGTRRHLSYSMKTLLQRGAVVTGVVVSKLMQTGKTP